VARLDHQAQVGVKVVPFFFICSNWRGKPLRDYHTIVQLIANSTTAKRLTVRCR